MIRVNNLSKQYKILERKNGFLSSIQNLFCGKYNVLNAVNSIHFNIEQGEIVGFIGPNGAGKSTTIKMLTGVLQPSSGEIEINNLIPGKDRNLHAKQIGVVFGQKSQLWWDIPVIESYKLLKSIYKIPHNLFNKNLRRFIELLELDDFINQPVRQLSLGQRMKADFAASLLHDPKILFLDEPTIGIDIVAKQKIRTFIKEISLEKKVTVLLTTHDIRDIELLCDRVIIIDNGKILFDGSLKSLKEQFQPNKVIKVTFKNNLEDINVPQTTIIKEEGKTKYFSLEKKFDDTADFLQNITAKYSITDISVVDPDIEGIISSIYTNKLEGVS